MFKDYIEHLPIYEVVGDLQDALSDHDHAVLQAPPGSGKTTLAPLSLLDQPWLEGQKILMLEPRRMAARSAAARMAALLGEVPGETVGYRIRLDNCVSDQTRLEVVTEGILTRMLQRDPALEGVGLVIFDEFHERNLDSDLCLALCLQGREVFREDAPLKLLVMSATLDGDAVASVLGGAPLITSEGRQFPVECVYGEPYQLREPIAPRVVQAVMHALYEQSGSILVFLPGQREIKLVARELSANLVRLDDDSIRVEPLYGTMSLEKQQRAVEPAPVDLRKVVLATNVAETSLTIDGIEVVIDSGLMRTAVFDPVTGMTRLATRRVSRSSAEQRRGRAGRLGPGYCYRLWSEEQHQRLVAHTSPEILQEDLAPMALQLLSWGIADPGELAWLDSPPKAAYDQALSTLELCGAVFSTPEGSCQLTPHGVRLAQMPLHPRLAHMLLVGCDIHASETACLLAAVLSERNPLASYGADLGLAIAVLMGEARCPTELERWFKRIWQQARRFARLAGEIHKPRQFALTPAQTDILGILLSCAYPDRLARLRPGGEGIRYQLSNGRTAVLPANDPLAGTEWLAVAELGGEVGGSEDRIYSASRLSAENFDEILAPLVSEREHVEWDYRQERFVAEFHRMVGNIVLAVEPLAEVPDQARMDALLGLVRKKGLDLLPWTPALMQWRRRIEVMYALDSEAEDNPWPDMSEEGLLRDLEDWLLPYLIDVRRLDDFRNLDLKSILSARMPWPLPLELERLAPERWAAPSGSSITIDYSVSPPVLAVKLQEMFGCEATPTIADGRLALMVHLLSPAQRPLQVTQDLASFWRNGYDEVRREMRGRYPKHPWPEDPLNAQPTANTKRSSTLN